MGAAMRAGDWKLLTGNAVYEDWIPPRYLPVGPDWWQTLDKQQNELEKSIWLFIITPDP